MTRITREAVNALEADARAWRDRYAKAARDRDICRARIVELGAEVERLRRRVDEKTEALKGSNANGRALAQAYADIDADRRRLWEALQKGAGVARESQHRGRSERTDPDAYVGDGRV